MKTLRQLINSTPSDVAERSRNTIVVIMGGVKRIYDDGLQTVVFKAQCRAHTERVYYEVLIEMYPTEIHQNVFKKPSLDNPTFVKCQCPYFLYHCEYALARVGSSEIDYSNGKRPLITNPNNIPYLCKHLYKAGPLVVKEAQKILPGDKNFSYTKT